MTARPSNNGCRKSQIVGRNKLDGATAESSVSGIIKSLPETSALANAGRACFGLAFTSLTLRQSGKYALADGRTLPRYQHGVTLVELILAMLIISISMVGILSVINQTVSHSADPVVQHQAVAIAESYLEEILLQSYSGGASVGRANFDDVDDYNGLNDAGVQDQLGNAVPGLSQYTVTVTVSAAAALAGGVNAKRISVNVSGPGVTGLSLVGYKTNY